LEKILSQMLYPPRPKGRMRFSELPGYEKTGQWLAQRKFNGTRTLVYVNGDDVRLQSREGDGKHERFQLSQSLKEEILLLDLDRSKEYWLDGEILDSKTKNLAYKDKIVFFDILQEGEYFFGAPTLLERYEILNRICRYPQEKEPGGLALKSTENLWLAENFFSDFIGRFHDFIDRDEIEGLVLKKRNSVIDNIGAKYYEIHWQIRCRKPHKNYNF